MIPITTRRKLFQGNGGSKTMEGTIALRLRIALSPVQTQRVPGLVALPLLEYGLRSDE